LLGLRVLNAISGHSGLATVESFLNDAHQTRKTRIITTTYDPVLLSIAAGKLGATVSRLHYK